MDSNLPTSFDFLGDGKINETNYDEIEIEIPKDLCVPSCKNLIETIVREIYGNTYANENDPNFWKKRAILSLIDDDVDEVNQYMLSQLPGDEVQYLISDSIETSDAGVFDDRVYSQEFLKDVKVSELTKHVLTLKIGAPIMLLMNLDPKSGLCYGTRLIITHLGNCIIEANIITCDHVGDKVIIPRMFVSQQNSKFPFIIRWRQFPVALAFAITINKSHGQTFEHVGLYLPKQVITHGQLYVALSRVTSRNGLKILISDENGM